MPSIPVRTFIIATCLVLGVALLPYLGSLLQWPRAPEEVLKEPPVEQALPEVAMIEPREDEIPDPPEPVVEPDNPEPIQYQSAPAPSAERETAGDSQTQDLVPEPVPMLPEPEEEEAALEKLAKEEAKKPQQADSPPKVELPEREKLAYSELVAAGLRLKKDGIKSPSYKARMSSEVIESLIRNGSVRLAVTDGKSAFLFSGTLKQPGKGHFAFDTDFKGLSTRYMALAEKDGRQLLRVASDKFLGAAAQCQPVVFLRSDLDSMVLGAQNRAAISNGTALEKIKSTRGSFRFYQGMPFNYSIDEITDSRGNRIPVDGGKGVRKKGERS